jgi:hypothetical protein
VPWATGLLHPRQSRSHHRDEFASPGGGSKSDRGSGRHRGTDRLAVKSPAMTKRIGRVLPHSGGGTSSGGRPARAILREEGLG